MPKIKLNGSEINVMSGSVRILVVEEQKLIPEHVVVELNGKIIKRESWEATPIMDGDEVEIVSFVGGG